MKHKLTVEKETRFKNRTLSFLVDNVREWKYRIPYKRNETTGPFYILTFKCLDSNKALTYLRNHFSLGSVLSKDVVDNCIVYKNILPIEQKKMYTKLAKNHLYIRERHMTDSSTTFDRKRKPLKKEEDSSSFKKQKKVEEEKPKKRPPFIGKTIKRAPFLGSKIILTPATANTLNSTVTPTAPRIIETPVIPVQEDEDKCEEIDLDELKNLLDMAIDGESSNCESNDSGSEDEDDLLLFNFINNQ